MPACHAPFEPGRYRLDPEAPKENAMSLLLVYIIRLLGIGDASIFC